MMYEEVMMYVVMGVVVMMYDVMCEEVMLCYDGCGGYDVCCYG